MARVAAPREGEEILLEERKSFVVKTRQVTIFAVLLVAALIILFTIQNNIISGIAFVLLIAALAYGLYNFVIWYYDLYLITNMRVMIISQKGLFSREFVEVEISDITDVRYSVKGLLATLFHHGTVQITAAGGQTYELFGVSNPVEVRETIMTVASTLRRHISQ